MSHISQSERFTPPLRANQPDPRTSPLNALSNQSPKKVNSSSPRSGLTNTLIPRDYLSSKSETKSGTNGVNSARPAPMTTGRNLDLSVAASNLHNLQENSMNASKHPDNEQYLEKQRTERDQTANGDRSGSLKIGQVKSLASADGSGQPYAGPKGSTAPNSIPRTSSIDSAISSVSLSSAQNRNMTDTRPPTPNTLRSLIETAGGAENLVLHLLKEKNQANAQNSQLWKLVEKQRALLIGLNKDLDRMSKERDKYKKRLKDLQESSPMPSQTQQSVSESPWPTESSGLQKSLQPDVMEGPGPAIAADQGSSTGPIPVQHTRIQGESLDLGRNSPAGSETSSLYEKPNKPIPSLARKAPPKPLNLSQSKDEVQEQLAAINNTNHSRNVTVDSDAADEDDDDSRLRGRRKTREEDDRDREVALKKEQEARSRSKKSVPPQQIAAPAVGELRPPQGLTLPSSPRPQVQKFMVAEQLGGIAVATPHQPSLGDVLAPSIRSPGLPATPRPMNQTFASLNSLPLSPRLPVGAFPLSPRAPKQPLPVPMTPTPFTDPAVQQRQNNLARQTQMQTQASVNQAQNHDAPTANDIPPIFKGLVSPAYPDLLLPPNALPSIQVKVASSRLKPSRNSMLGMKIHEDSIVFSLSIFSRASRSELWRIEKVPSALPALEQQLRPRVSGLPRMPDRKLFSGQAPTVVDQRRQAIDTYFDELLDIPIDEHAALYICRFLSTDVLNPDDHLQKSMGVNQESPVQNSPTGSKGAKAGWLTKRGKNFGGWKSRYFVLDSAELRYFETPGGALIGTIKINQARVGAQKTEDGNNEADDPYRHAFLIQEPKKKDSASFVRHILCAESDAERDEWVAALLQYNELGANDLEARNVAIDPPGKFDIRPIPSITVGAKDKFPRSDEIHSNSTSPTSISSASESPSNDVGLTKGNISAPMNGSIISNSAQWGNKPAPLQNTKDKSKKTNIFHFRKSSQEAMFSAAKQTEAQTPKPRILRHNGYVRPVFGLSLAEAVEYCAPFNVDVKLPAVVYRCIEYLQYRRAEAEEGIFRLSGSNVVVKSLKERFNTEGDVDLVDDEEYHDVHAVASLFKNYLRELPSTILTRELHLEFLAVLELETQEQKVKAFNVLVHRLPIVNATLLRAMCSFLLQVIENAAKSKMSVKNIGIVFSPTLNIPVPVFTLFLTEFDAIFEKDPTMSGSGQTRTVEVTAPASFAPVDIRSPRHQMFSDLPTPAYNQTSFQNAVPGISHQMNAPSDFGMAPIHQSYERGNYVSMVQGSRQPQHPVAIQRPTTDQDDGQTYGSLNRMLVPENTTSAKARKRESAILF